MFLGCNSIDYDFLKYSIRVCDEIFEKNSFYTEQLLP